MSVPEPPTSLDGSCSVIHDNTLYSVTSESFLSLALEEGAEWKKLDSGEKVSGASCVGTSSALFVVGGTTDNADFTGLQKYTYDSGKWETLTPSDLVTKNRQWHSTTYIKANDAIVIYGGNQDGNYGPSSQVFTIQASEPYTMENHQASTSALLPILLSWSDADAVMIGGDPANTKVYLFNPTAGWRDFGASLAQPIAKDTTSIQGVLVDGGDKSKSLITFDMSQSPNQVERMVLQDENGTPVTNSAPVSSKSKRRDLTLGNWPKYDSELAPSSTRQNFAMAQGSDGKVVFTGGSADDPIAMFDPSDNSWMNTTKVFSPENKLKAMATSTTSSSSTSTETSTSTSTSSTSTIASTTSETTAASTTDAAAAPISSGKDDDDSGMDSNKILGITLGTILGFMAILGLIILLLRRRKRRQNHSEVGHARKDSGLPVDEKNPGAFTNDANPPRSPGHFRGHHPQLSQESYSSMAILMGRMGQQKQSLSRKTSNDTSRSSVSSLHKQFKSTISKPIPQQEPAIQGHDDRGVAFAPSVSAPRPRPRNGGTEAAPDGTRRSSGWNRYWSGGSALQILGFGGSKRTTGGSEQSSRYSDGNSQNPRITQDSATVPPLNFEGRPEVNSVVSGSPVVAQQNNKVASEGMSGQIERPVSKESSGYSSGIPESVSEFWHPADGNKPWGTDRAPSSAYAPSYYYGTPLAPSSAGARKPPSGMSQQPQLAMASTSDMSWLNLGDQSRV